MRNAKISGRTALLCGVLLLSVLFVAEAFPRMAVVSNEGAEISAQDWDLTWSGRVDATAELRIRGRFVTTRTISGRPTSGVTFNFRNGLPTNRPVQVSVRKRDGRGDVLTIQQPSRFNNYTAVFRIRDDKGGADNYRLEFNWGGGYGNEDYDRPGNPNFDDDAEMTWQGTVDARVHVRIRNRFAETRTISGQSVYGVRYDFRRALPSNNTYVTLRKREGRGSVRILEQPDRFNGYSALVEIYDDDGGADFYAFELNWSGGNNFPDYPEQGRGDSMTWSGRVDAVARVQIRGNRATTLTISGQSTRNVSYDFNGSLPRRTVFVRVDKRDGRGTVRVIQQPSVRNGYTAVVEIRDPKGGQDNYSFDLFW